MQTLRSISKRSQIDHITANWHHSYILHTEALICLVSSRYSLFADWLTNHTCYYNLPLLRPCTLKSNRGTVIIHVLCFNISIVIWWHIILTLLENIDRKGTEWGELSLDVTILLYVLPQNDNVKFMFLKVKIYRIMDFSKFQYAYINKKVKLSCCKYL